MSPSPSPSSPPGPLHLAVALDGTGWHPASWRETVSRPGELLTARYWLDTVQEAESGLLDFVTFEDALSLQSTDPAGDDRRTDQVRGRLDAVLTASTVAPLTRHIGLVPTAVVTHTEPFHLAKAIATLDHVSAGRAGVRVRVSASPQEVAHFGRRQLPDVTPGEAGAADREKLAAELLGEAADYVEVLRRLWDSWEDDAEIRDVATGRFIDRAKLHYIDFRGDRFSVKGPSITPRSPQGQPLVTALAHGSVPYGLVARSADVGYVTPHDAAGARAAAGEILAARDAAGRHEDTVHVFGDLVVFIDESAAAAKDRRQRLDDTAGAPLTSDAEVFTGTPAELAGLLLDWQRAGLTGYRLRPAVTGHDLPAITRGLVPELQSRGAFRRAYEADSLRGLLGLARPANRYAQVRAGGQS
ncbi:LLM class flavin-dependent oxidoreductase [Streptomyces sp. NBC_00388]|uniref:LLM class flavin-dependent oxidoreductase n=1 Tax=Streptomyces sp. NBC_00388 TaxID=2975735 RepID=UPI002E244E85